MTLFFVQEADTTGLSSEERGEVGLKDGVDDVKEEVDDEQMDDVITGKVVEAMRSNDNWGFNNWRSCAGGHIYLVGRSFPRAANLRTRQWPHDAFLPGVGVPLRRGVALPRAATR